METFDFRLKKPLQIKCGIVTMPEGVGQGIDLGWDFIDNTTFEKL